MQYVNNVIYNWGVCGYVGGHSAGDHYADLINNYFIKGPNSNEHFIGEFKATDHIYQAGNFADLNCDGELNGHLVTTNNFNFGGDNSPTLVGSPVAAPPLPFHADDALVAYQKVIASSGASLHRDAVDKRLIEDLTSLGKRGQTVHDPEEMGGFGDIVGGLAPLDTDGDGMPDAWETTHGSNPKVSDGNTFTASGYTRLEEYLNSLVAAQTITGK